MKKVFLLLLTICISFFQVAMAENQTKIDSLGQVLEIAEEDTNKSQQDTVGSDSFFIKVRDYFLKEWKIVEEIGNKDIGATALGDIAIVFLFLAVISYNRYRLKQKANKTLTKALDDLKKAQTQLVQSEKMASLGQLTAGVAHEINNPINFVSGNIAPLKRDIDEIMHLLEIYSSMDHSNYAVKLNETLKYRNQIDLNFTMKEIKSLIQGIEEGSNRTAAIVKGLRNFSRLDEEEMKATNIHEGVESTLLLLNNRLSENKIEAIKSFGNVPDIKCYPGQLNQVFMNIITNAMDSIGTCGKIFITTSAENNQLKITIRDTGRGMSDDVKQKIFDPFFTTKDVGKGTGLGLSISYGIIKKHSGSIEVKSEMGNGAEFIVTLPIAL